MSQPRVLIVRAPGTNCDQETAYAFEQCGGQVEVVHLNRWLETPNLLKGFQILCFPGGFSFGDDIAAGRIVAAKLQRHLGDIVREFTASDSLVLGICNGFQILIKSGLLLPASADGTPQATLDWNDHGRFEDRWVRLRTYGDRCVFLKGMDQVELPIAHAEGKFMTADGATLQQLDDNQQLVLRYTNAGGESDADLGFPENPNGSQANVAGVCDETGRIFGLMPHPERFFDFTHHPQWTRIPRDQHPEDGRGAGRAIFENAIAYFS